MIYLVYLRKISQSSWSWSCFRNFVWHSYWHHADRRHGLLPSSDATKTSRISAITINNKHYFLFRSNDEKQSYSDHIPLVKVPKQVEDNCTDKSCGSNLISVYRMPSMCADCADQQRAVSGETPCFCFVRLMATPAGGLRPPPKREASRLLVSVHLQLA